MRSVRVIPCLDVDAGRVVKGTRFEDLRDAGDPVELAARYGKEGADEICFLDISASHEARGTMVETVRAASEEVFIPLTVGGGVWSVDDARGLLRAGADKIAVNSAAVERPQLVEELAAEFGAQCIVVAIDSRQGRVHTFGGRTRTDLDTVAWASACAASGAGEILLTSMERDGTRAGFDLGLTRRVVDAVGVPVVASGGAGSLDHLVAGAVEGRADAVLAASIFHFGQHTVAEAKAHLSAAGVVVRPVSNQSGP